MFLGWRSRRHHSALNTCRRKQRVRVHGEFSCWIEVLSGIPQRSILGPLLFIIFINDLVSTCDDSVNLYLFADDAKLYCHIKDDVDKFIFKKRLTVL